MRTIKEISAQKKVKYYINNVIKQKEKNIKKTFLKIQKFLEKFFFKNDPEENRGGSIENTILSFFKIQT